MGLGFTVRLDLQEFRTALTDQNLPRALSLYGGPFLASMDHSDWVQGLQMEARLGLGILVQQRAEAELQADLPLRAIAACEQYLAVDSELVEVHEVRLKAAKRLGDPRRIAQYSAEWQNLV